MSKKLLFIEDEEEFAKPVSSYLEKEGFIVESAFSGKRGLRKIEKNSYDLVILDLGLPDIEGFLLCKKIREKMPIPIFILTAKDTTKDRVKGLSLGADDYLVKPASLKELVVRVKRLLKRDLKNTFRSSEFRFDSIKFNVVSGRLNSRKKSQKLTKKERAVLEFLLIKQGQVLNRMEIMDHVWGTDIDIFSNTVNMVISTLRKKLRQLSNKDFIRSIHGVGYKFEVK